MWRYWLTHMKILRQAVGDRNASRRNLMIWKTAVFGAEGRDDFHCAHERNGITCHCFHNLSFSLTHSLNYLFLKMHPCTGAEALYRLYGPQGGRGTALPFQVHGTRRGWGVRVTPWPLFNPGKDPVHIVQEAVWGPGPVWTGAENLAPHRDSIPGPSSP